MLIAKLVWAANPKMILGPQVIAFVQIRDAVRMELRKCWTHRTARGVIRPILAFAGAHARVSLTAVGF